MIDIRYCLNCNAQVCSCNSNEIQANNNEQPDSSLKLILFVTFLSGLVVFVKIILGVHSSQIEHVGVIVGVFFTALPVLWGLSPIDTTELISDKWAKPVAFVIMVVSVIAAAFAPFGSTNTVKDATTVFPGPTHTLLATTVEDEDTATPPPTWTQTLSPTAWLSPTETQVAACEVTVVAPQGANFRKFPTENEPPEEQVTIGIPKDEKWVADGYTINPNVAGDRAVWLHLVRQESIYGYLPWVNLTAVASSCEYTTLPQLNRELAMRDFPATVVPSPLPIITNTPIPYVPVVQPTQTAVPVQNPPGNNNNGGGNQNLPPQPTHPPATAQPTATPTRGIIIITFTPSPTDEGTDPTPTLDIEPTQITEEPTSIPTEEVSPMPGDPDDDDNDQKENS